MNNILPVDKIFVCHHKPLVHRKERLNGYFSSQQITDIEWVEKYLPEDISDDYNELVGKQYLNIGGMSEPNQYPWENDNVGKSVSISELSLYLKHQYCFEEQIKQNYEYILILEDDAIIPDNFREYLNLCMDEFVNHSPKLDCLMIGTCCGFKCKNISSDKMVYYDPGYMTRCTGAMIFSIEASKKVLKYLYPINWPIDFKLNQIMYKEKFRVGHVEPPIYQGADLGLDTSYIQH